MADRGVAHKPAQNGGSSTRDSRRKPAHERRAELIHEAVESYLELGLGRAGHGDVARRAGVSTGTVFNYFPSRDELTEAVLAHVIKVILRLFENLDAPTPSFRKNVSMIQEGLDRGCTVYPGECKLFLSWGASFNPDLRKAYRNFYEALVSGAEPYLSNSDDSDMDVRIMIGAGIIYMQMFYDGTDQEVRNRFANRFGEMLAAASQNE